MILYPLFVKIVRITSLTDTEFQIMDQWIHTLFHNIGASFQIVHRIKKRMWFTALLRTGFEIMDQRI